MVIRLLIALFAYLIGSVSFGVIVSKAMRLSDPRAYGSKNPGATNVLRSGNVLAAALTLLGDALKGWFAVRLAVWCVDRFGSQHGMGEEAIALAALAVFAGHLWPVFFGLKGGKGVATAAGVLFAIHPLLGAASAATWLIIAFFFRYSSLAALVTAVFAPLYQVFMFGSSLISAALLTMSMALIVRHRSNIAKLLAGSETHITGRSSRQCSEKR